MNTVKTTVFGRILKPLSNKHTSGGYAYLILSPVEVSINLCLVLVSPVHPADFRRRSKTFAERFT